MRKHLICGMLVTGAGLLLTAQDVAAQIIGVPSSPRPRSAYSAPSSPSAPYSRRRPISKPFSHIQSRPTVSPYLNLTRDDSGAAANYQTLVRPQMEQMDFNRQQQLQYDRLDRQFENFRSQSAYPLGGSNEIRATGHATRFQNLSHYYPAR